MDIIMTALIVGCLSQGVVHAKEPSAGTPPTAIKWSNLAPPGPFPDPFTKLNQRQLSDLGFIVRVRNQFANEKVAADNPDLQDAKERAQRLTKDGVDINWLLAQRRHVQRMREIQANTVNPELKGKTVTLSGFVHPLEMSGKQVIEFLLVPYFDACSHGTPPSPNQIVLVKSSIGIPGQARFTVVQVTGQLQAKRMEHSRFGKTGRQTFHSAYEIKVSQIKVMKDRITD